MSDLSTPLAAVCYRLALRAFPSRLRAQYGDEMSAAFLVAYAQRRGLSPGAGRNFATRAWFDAVRAGFGSRFGRGVGPRDRRGTKRLREAREWLWLELGTDLRSALRTVAKEPAFALTVIVVLALGVGVNGALSNALRAVFLTPAPFAEPERLVILDLAEQSTENDEPPSVMIWSYPKYQVLESIEDLAASPIAAYARRSVTITGRGTAQQRTAEIITRDYFKVLGVSVPGQDLASDETILSHALALSLFGEADPVGEIVLLNGQAQVVAGVADAGLRGLTGGAELWIPMAAVPRVIQPTLLENIHGHWLLGIGRLAAGRTAEELAAQMPAVGARIQELHPWTDPTVVQTGAMRSFDAARQNPLARRAVGIVSSAAGVVLLIACLNLAVLMHARVRARQREIAVRLALGSSRLRGARTLMVEAMTLAVVAGIVGVGVAAGASGAIARAWPSSFMDGTWNVRFVDASGLQFGFSSALVTFALAAIAGLLFAVFPILRVTRADVAAAMRGGGRTESEQTRASRWLVAAEVAIALVLTVGAGLMISSLSRLASVPHGFDSDNLLVFDYSLARGSVEAEDPAAFHDAFLQRVRGLPGVVGATFECGAPLDGHCWITGVKRAGERHFGEGERPFIGVHIVDEAHFTTVGIPLRSGRDFRADEGAESPRVVVINEAAALKLFPDSDPLGQPFSAGVGMTEGESTAAIIGVVADVLYNTPAEGIMPEMYILHRQEAGRSASVIVRTRGEPLGLLPRLRAELATMAPDVPLTGARTIASIEAAALGDTTVVMRLLAAFAGLAIVLAATGVWGTVAQAVGQRRREMGIRMALGAEARQVVRQSLGFGLVWAVGGALVGLVGAYFLTRTMSALLFEVQATDTLAYASSAVLLVLVSLLASYIPARRAGRVDPVRTLRTD
jgi:predicted permease